MRLEAGFGELRQETMRDAATIVLLLLPTLAVVSSRYPVLNVSSQDLKLKNRELEGMSLLMSKLTLTPCVFFFFLKLRFSSSFEIALISERIFFLLLLFSKGRASPGLFFYRGAFVSNSFG